MAASKVVLVFLFGVFLSVAFRDDFIDTLKKLIKDQKDQTSAMQAKNRGLQSIIQNLPAEYKEKIINISLKKYNASQELKVQYKSIREIRQNIIYIDYGTFVTDRHINDTEKELLKLEYFSKWIQQHIGNLKLRRSKKENEKCFKLMYRGGNNVSDDKRSLTGEKKQTDTRKELMKELEEATKAFESTQQKNKELTATLKKDTAYWEKVYQDAVAEFEIGSLSLEEAKKRKKALEEDLEIKSKSFAQLKEKLAQVRGNVKKMNEQAKKIKDELGKYQKDSTCYAKLENEILKKLH